MSNSTSGSTDSGEMRESETHITDQLGIKLSESLFLALRWAPIENKSHDLGTDLLVACRDPRLFDRGFLIGAQVKTGSSYFDEPATVEGHAGWWYRESTSSHFNSWVKHSLPHLILLVDLEASAVYWQHVTSDRVEQAGEGLKIFVPSHQTLDPEHLPVLLEIAGGQEKQGAGAPRQVPPADRLRYSLVAPFALERQRTKAGAGRMSADEYIALLVTGRKELVRGGWSLPSRPTWTDRFAAAIDSWLYEEDESMLRGLMSEDIRRLRQRAAALAVLARLLRAEERFEELAAVLTPTIEADRLAPVDHAWLLLHRSWAYYELGSMEAAHDDALAAVAALHPLDRTDLPAVAFSRAAIEMVFRLMAANSSAGVRLTPRSDDRVATWRDLRVASAVRSAATKSYTALTPRRTVQFGVDMTEIDLSVAELNASICGDLQSWRTISSDLAKHILVTNRSEAEFVDAIDLLRRCGQAKAVSDTCSRLLRVGPVAPLIAACRDTHLLAVRWGRTSAPASLDLLEKVAAHALSEVQARGLANKLLPVMRLAPQPGQGDRPPLADHPDKALAVMSRLLRLSTRKSDHRQAGSVLARELKGRQPDRRELEQIAEQIDIELLTESGRRSIRAVALAVPHEAATLILGKLAKADDADAVKALVERAISGDATALDQIDSGILSAAQSRMVIEDFASRVSRIIADARSHSFSMYTFDQARALVVANVRHPRQADWDTLIQFLEDESVLGSQKTATIRFLAQHFERIPRSVRGRLRSAELPLPDVTPGAFFGDEAAGAKAALRFRLLPASAKLDSLAVRLSLGGRDSRVDLGGLLGLKSCTHLAPMLASLLADPEPDVSAAAARTVGHLAVNDQRTRIDDLVRYAVGHPSVAVPIQLLEGIRRGMESSSDFVGDRRDWISTTLRDHPSLEVRRGCDLVLG